MHPMFRTTGHVLLGSAAVALFVTTAHGQGSSILGAPSEANHFIETPRGWVHPKTPWGDPDLQGTFTFSYVGTVGLERCAGGGRGNAAPCDTSKAWLNTGAFLSSNPAMRPGGVGLTFYDSAR